MPTRSSKPWLSLAEKLGHPAELTHAILEDHEERLNQLEAKKIPWLDYCIQGASLLGSLNADKINAFLRAFGL